MSTPLSKRYGIPYARVVTIVMPDGKQKLGHLCPMDGCDTVLVEQMQDFESPEGDGYIKHFEKEHDGE